MDFQKERGGDVWTIRKRSTIGGKKKGPLGVQSSHRMTAKYRAGNKPRGCVLKGFASLKKNWFGRMSEWREVGNA